MYRTRIDFTGGMNILGDLSGSQKECLFAANADIRTGVIRPFAAPALERLDDTNFTTTNQYFFIYRGRWIFSDKERKFVGTFDQGSEIIAWTEYGGTAMKMVNGTLAPMGTLVPHAALQVANAEPLYQAAFFVDRVPGGGNLSATERFYRLAPKNAFGILPPTGSLAVQNVANDANLLSWAYVPNIANWEIFAGSQAGSEALVAEVSADVTQWEDIGTASSIGAKASDYDITGSRSYVYTYVRTIGGVQDESGPSPVSAPMDFKHGITIDRQPQIDGYFDQPHAQVNIQVTNATLAANANILVDSFQVMSEFQAVKFHCTTAHGFINGDTIYFGGSGWSEDENYNNKTFTVYVPDGDVSNFYIKDTPTPSSLVVMGSNTTVTESIFNVTLQPGQLPSDHSGDPIIASVNPSNGSFWDGYRGDAIFLDLLGYGKQIGRVVGWDATNQIISVQGQGISVVESTDIKFPTTATVQSGIVPPNSITYNPPNDFSKIVDGDVSSYASFDILIGQGSYISDLYFGAWQPHDPTGSYTGHVLAKLVFEMVDPGFWTLSGASMPTITVDASADSFTTSVSMLAATPANTLTSGPIVLTGDLGVQSDVVNVQIRIRVNWVNPFTSTSNINIGVFKVFDVRTEAQLVGNVSASGGTASWVPGNGYVTNWKLYRTGDTGDFLLVDNYDIYTMTVSDTRPTLALGEAIPSFYNDGVQDVIYKPPPQGMMGLINHNGSWMGIDGNTVRYSPSGKLDSYPDAYTATFDKKPTALASYNGAATILLPDGIWRLDGSDPSVYVLTKTAAADGCIAPYSVQEIRNKLVFLGPRGITVFDGMRSECISDRRMPYQFLVGSAYTNPDVAPNADLANSRFPLIPPTMTRAYEDATAEFGSQGVLSPTPSGDPSLDVGDSPGKIWDNTAAMDMMRYLRSFTYQGKYFLYWSQNAMTDPSGFNAQAWGCWVVDFESPEMPISFMPLRISDAILSEDQILYWYVSPLTPSYNHREEGF